MSDDQGQDRLLRLIGDFAQQIGQQEQDRFEGMCCDRVTASQSPIEKLMAAALFFAMKSQDWYGDGPVENNFCGARSPQINTKTFIPGDAGLHVIPQCKVGKYIADFMVCLADWDGGYVWGAIECDGHDHHNITKKQAEHDRARDRAFQDAGIFILRYTGSEIWKSPLKCATDALGMLQRRAEADTALRWKAKF